MSVRELVLLIFWGISCILITVQIIKIRKEKAKIPDKDKNLAKFMVGMIVVASISSAQRSRRTASTAAYRSACATTQAAS